jgi:peptidoglycan/xylan/chitin deacetylase (PgdA/CDA1 family)
MNSLGQSAQTLPFGYLTTTQPATDACGGTCAPACGPSSCGDDGCGGSCGSCASGQRCDGGRCVADGCDGGACDGGQGCDGGTCGGGQGCDGGACDGGQTCDGGACDAGCVAAWNPVWQQVNANNWWIEYTVSRGTVTSVWLEVVGGGRANLSLQWGKWVGSAPSKISTGAPVVLHATDDLGHTAQTVAFGYLTTPAPSTDACGGSGPAVRCAPLQAGMVSITLDDGWAGQYTLARDQLLAHDMKSTIFLITGRVGQGWTGYLTLQQAQALLADGNEVASHTVDHVDLTHLSDAGIDDQLARSKQWFETNLGVSVTDFASPFGAYDGRVIASAKRYYQTHSTVATGLNFPGDDLFKLKRYTVLSDTTPATIRSWVQEAQSQRGWLILLFHDFTSGTPSDAYRYRSSDFQTVLDDLAASGIEVVTVSQGAARLACP